jgi:hypothetical protein
MLYGKLFTPKMLSSLMKIRRNTFSVTVQADLPKWCKLQLGGLGALGGLIRAYWQIPPGHIAHLAAWALAGVVLRVQ